MHPFKQFLRRYSLDFWALATFLALLAFMAGSSRADISSLILIRPVAVLFCAYSLARMTPAQFRSNLWFLWFSGAIFLLTLLHLVPLPPAIWQALPARGLIADIDRQAGLGNVWRPISIAPLATRNTLFSLFVPLAAGLALMRLRTEERLALLPFVIGFGCISLIVSMLQVIAPSAKGLWFYRVTNDGLPVGLFANRNHSAIFLAAMPAMLTVWAQLPTSSSIWYRAKRIGALGFGIVTIAVVTATGSRAGLLLSMVGLGSVPFLMTSIQARKPSKPSRLAWFSPQRALIASIAIVAIGLIGFSLNSARQGSAIERLSTSSSGDMRETFWSATAPLVTDYFPLGSGLGTFVEGYKAGEPHSALNPSYTNHAHNDPLELAMTGGLPAILAMIVAVGFIARSAWRAWRPGAGRSRVPHRRMGSVILLVLLLGSIVDYPLRLPSLTAFAVLAMFWLCARNEDPGRRSNEGMAISKPLV